MKAAIDGEALALGLRLALGERDGLSDAEGESEGLTLALGE